MHRVKQEVWPSLTDPGALAMSTADTLLGIWFSNFF